VKIIGKAEMPKVFNDGSKFVTKVTALSSTNDTDCYVVAKNFSSRVENMMIANNDGSNRTFTVKYYEKAANTTHTLIDTHTLATKTTTNVFTADTPLYIHAEDKLIVDAGTADTLVVVISAEEFFDPTY
jgi:predicted GH43/DUF377 family glycosyl hydrolase